MDNEVKYTDRFLKLNRESSVEESKLAYDEMAPSWEKVYKCSDKWITVLCFRELYFPFLTYKKEDNVSLFKKLTCPLNLKENQNSTLAVVSSLRFVTFPDRCRFLGNCPPTPPLTQR